MGFRDWGAKEFSLVLAFLIQFAMLVVWGARLDSGMEQAQHLLRGVQETANRNEERLYQLELKFEVSQAVQQALERYEHEREQTNDSSSDPLR